jgi:uncharacterized coiled-coil protein SlyX
MLGVGQKAVISGFSRLNASSDHLLSAEREMREKQVRLVNISQDLPETKLAESSLASLTKNSIPVVSAGNSYPRPLTFIKNRTDAIIVGSLSPKGVVSIMSQEGKNVTLLAPGDKWLMTEFKGGDLDDLGATSGATALVTGCLSNVLTYLPHLTLEESKRLLQKTSVATWNVRLGDRKNGVGMINCLKATKVARNLAEQKFESKNTEERLKILEEEKTYEVTGVEELTKMVAEGKKLLQQNDCAVQKQGQSLLREAVLLMAGPSTRVDLKNLYIEAIRELVNHYRNSKLISMADFYESLVPGKEYLYLDRVLVSSSPLDKRSLIRAYATAYPNEAGDFLYKQTEDKEDAFPALRTAGGTPTIGIEFFQRVLKNSENDSVRRSAATYLSMKPGAGKFVKDLLSSPTAFEERTKYSLEKNGNTLYGLVGGIRALDQDAPNVIANLIREPKDTVRGRFLEPIVRGANIEAMRFGPLLESDVISYVGDDPERAKDIARGLRVSPVPNFKLIKVLMDISDKFENQQNDIRKYVLLALAHHHANGHSLLPFGKAFAPRIRLAAEKSVEKGEQDLAILLNQIVNELEKGK